jgi:hypothetical protein
VAGFSLERVLGGAISLVQEAVKVREKSGGKKPARGMAFTDDPRIDGVRAPLARPASPSASAESSSLANRPVVHSLGHLIDAGRHRMFGSASRATAESVLVAVCPGCGGTGRHDADCPRMLADFGLTEDMWETSPQQIGETDFDRFWESRSRSER